MYPELWIVIERRTKLDTVKVP